MAGIDEKRVFGDRDDRTELLVAADVGVVAVGASEGRVGEFGVAHRCSPRDVAAREGTVAVATDEDVLVRDEGEFEETGSGPAVAVGIGDGILAAREDGRISRREDDEWEPVGELDDVVAIDGDLLAADDGVYRVGTAVQYVGLEGVRDVSATGAPLAATADGLFALGNGWMRVAAGDFRVVASDGDRAHAATEDALAERVEHDAVGDARTFGEPTPDGARGGGDVWREVDLPTDEPVVDVTYGDVPYAVTGAGTILAPGGEQDDGEWRAHPLGLGGAVAIASVR